MFELYARQIDLDNAEFQAFIKQFLQARESRDPEKIPYAELYQIIREGIDQYLQKRERTSERDHK